MPYLRWLTGLTLPGLLLAILGLSALWIEYRTHYAAVRLGEYLLQHNHERKAHGATWQGILASRRSRSSLEHQSQSDTLRLETIPPGQLHYRYEAEEPTADFLVLRAQGRKMPLRLGQVSGQQMQSLAHSLQVHRQGEELLSHIQLPRDPFRVHAQIQAQIALEDGSLFQVLHGKLARINAPEAWIFVKMSAADQDYWRDYLERFLAWSAAGFTPGFEEFQDTTSTLTGTCTTLLKTWEDSLYADELTLLQQAWAQGAEIEIRMVRNMDIFTGYFLMEDELPIRFTIPTDQVTAVPRKPERQEEEP